MLQSRVENFFQAMEFRTPEIFHLFEADVQMTTQVAQSGVVHEDSDQHGDGGWNGSQGDCQKLRDV